MKYIIIVLCILLATVLQVEARGIMTVGGGTAVVASCTSSNDSEIYATANTYTEDGSYDENSWLAWSFVVAAGGSTITGAQVYINDYAQTSSAVVEFYTNSGAIPGTSLGASYTTATNSNLPDTMTNVAFLLATPQSFAAGTYWVVVKTTGASQYGHQASGGSGTFKYSTNSGEDWSTTTDFYIDLAVLGCLP